MGDGVNSRALWLGQHVPGPVECCHLSDEILTVLDPLFRALPALLLDKPVQIWAGIALGRIGPEGDLLGRRINEGA